MIAPPRASLPNWRASKTTVSLKLEVVGKKQEKLARPERLELPTLWFEARCSIQLSYERANPIINPIRPAPTQTPHRLRLTTRQGACSRQKCLAIHIVSDQDHLGTRVLRLVPGTILVKSGVFSEPFCLGNPQLVVKEQRQSGAKPGCGLQTNPRGCAGLFEIL